MEQFDFTGRSVYMWADIFAAFIVVYNKSLLESLHRNDEQA
jgi:hypothetical protein